MNPSERSLVEQVNARRAQDMTSMRNERRDTLRQSSTPCPFIASAVARTENRVVELNLRHDKRATYDKHFIAVLCMRYG